MYNDILPYPYIHGTAEYIVSTLQDLCNNDQIHGGNFIVVISKQMDNEYMLMVAYWGLTMVIYPQQWKWQIMPHGVYPMEYYKDWWIYCMLHNN